MPEIETSQPRPDAPDMSAKRFAELSEQALVALLGKEAAAEHVDFIRANGDDQLAVSSYLLSASLAHHEFDTGDLMAKVNEILESEHKTA